MDANTYKSAVADVLKELLGCSPEEFRKEQQARKEAQEEKDASVRRYVVELELNRTPEDYKKRAAHVINSDPFEGQGLMAARLVRAYAAAKRANQNPKDFVVSKWGDKFLAEDIEKAEQRALQTNIESDGGFIVPEDYRNSLIELLRNRTVVRRSGVPVVPMRRGSMTIPRQTSAATAAYVGEAQRIDPSQPAFGQINLLARKLAAITAVSNDLLRESDPQADMIVRNDLTKVMAIQEDASLLRGQGTQFSPQGLRYWINTNNVFATAGTSLDQKTTDLFEAMLRLESNNVDLFNACWFMSVRTKSGLMRQRDANGNFVFMEEMKGGQLLGFPFYATNQIPTNLSPGTATELYFVEVSECIIGDTMSLELVVEPNGTYTLANGTVVSGLSNDLTVVRTISKHDFAMRYDVAGAVVTGVLY